jgi:addiction module HigA family antidote
MDGGFRHQGLDEIYRTGKRRRTGADHSGKCERTLQLLDVAGNRRIRALQAFASTASKAGRNAGRCAGPGITGSVSSGRAKAPWMSIWKTAMRGEVMERNNGLPPVHPGGVIKEDILPSVGLSVTAAAKALGVSRPMLPGILAGRKPLSAILCLKVARLFGSSPEVSMRWQAAYNLKKSEHSRKVMVRVARIVPVKLVEEVRA